jgi:hypothetical protein
VAGTERGNADADEETGVVAVETALLHHVIGNVGRGSAAVERIADLMAGNDRRLSGGEGDSLGLQRIQEVGVDDVGVRTGRGDGHNTERRAREDQAGH